MSRPPTKPGAKAGPRRGKNASLPKEDRTLATIKALKSAGKKKDTKEPTASPATPPAPGGKATKNKVNDPKTKGNTPTPGKLHPADLKALRDAFEHIQSRPYTPASKKPKQPFLLPDGAFVHRADPFPKGVVDAKAAFEGLRADLPLLLFPVRLETRFTDNLTQLRIRIFPDQASVASLDPRLTAQEYQAGLTFLKTHDAAQKLQAKRAAWQQFATDYEPRRAAYITRAIRRGGAEKTLRQANDSHRALAPLLPDYWMVTGYAHGQVVFDKASRPVTRDLAFSPDFNVINPAKNDLSIDPAVRWMTSYTDALANGMAVTVDLPLWARDEIAEIYVVGVRSSDPANGKVNLSPTAAANQLDDLLASHLYDWGGGFAPPATATNNTSDVTAGWSESDTDLEELYSRFIAEPSTAVANPSVSAAADETLAPTGALDAAMTPEQTNFVRLETALGLPTHSILKQFDNRTGGEDAVQAAMNTLLWPVTLGELFGQLLQGRETAALGQDTTDWLRNWFISDLRGGSGLPTLRLGRTPYGVLPVQKTHLRKEMANLTGEDRRRQMLSVQIRSLLPLWEKAAEDVLRMGGNSGAIALQYPNPGDRFLQILRQQPSPSRFSLSSAISERNLFDLRYEIRNLIVHPAQASLLLKTVFANVVVELNGAKYTGSAPGRGAYYAWPEKFASGALQIDTLEQKRQILSDLLNINSSLYSPVIVVIGAAQLNIASLIALEMAKRRADIESLSGWLQEMIDICAEHRDTNLKLDAAFKPSSALYKGIVGYSSNDPHASYLSFEGGLRDWDTKAHVVAPSDAASVGFAKQVDYLLAYADSYISSVSAPAEPAFPGGKKPLLYRLLKEAIYRTGVDEDTSSLALVEIKNVLDDAQISATGQQAQIGDILAGLEARQVTALTQSVQALAGAQKTTKVKTGDDALARVLRGTSAKTFGDIAQLIDREIAAKSPSKPLARPEITALSAQLKSMSKADPKALGELTLSAIPNPRRQKINAMKQALVLLRDLNPDQIELLMTQTLGLASWRLDAWLTSLPARRIKDLRAGKLRHGIQIGAFGWVQNLKPNNRDAGDGNRVISQGFIHTPSLNHAKTAAVLRSGWTNYGTDAADSPLAVNLSSDRMRDAQWIFAAVRSGQDLGDVLGYRFERHLKDAAQAAHWIYPIRQAVLRLTGKPPDPEQPGVDGLELNRIQSTTTIGKLQSEAEAVLKDLGGADKIKTWEKVKEALAYLADQVDALADAAIADSVHALVQGNLHRAGSSLSAISDAEVPAPELDLLQTSPSAQTQTHRLALIAPQAQNAGTQWVSKIASYPAAAADPDAEGLVAALLGPADQLEFTVAYRSKDGQTLKQASLNWGEMLRAESPFAAPALQTLMLLPADGLSEACDLVRRVLGHAAAFPPMKLPSGCTVALALSPPQLATLTDLLDRWRAWRAVVLDGRPIDMRDILIADEEISVAFSDLETRAKTALDLAQNLAQDLLKALPKPTEGNDTPQGTMALPKLLARCDQLVRLGLSFAVYRGPTDTLDPAALWAHAWSLAPRLRKLCQDSSTITIDPSQPDEIRLKTARRALQAVFGAKFPGLVRLKTSSLLQLSSGLAQSEARIALTPGGTPAQWIEKLGYVRPALRAMNDAMLIQDCQPGAPGGVTLHVTQWPEEKLHPWIALSASKLETPPKTSFIAATVPHHSPDGLTTISGLVVDEIVDRVPATTLNSGVALHFDAPNTEAPQTLLLALPPEGEQWDYATLIDTVRDAFHLARIRAVDGPLLSEMHQILPAIYANKSTIAGAL